MTERSVIPRPASWPRDLALEAVKNQKRGSSSLRSFGTTSKGKIEVLPLRGCFAIALLRTTKNEAPAKGRERVVILNEVKDLAPKAVQIQSRDPSGEKHAVRMTGQR